MAQDDNSTNNMKTSRSLGILMLVGACRGTSPVVAPATPAPSLPTASMPAGTTTLTTAEQKMRDYVRAHHEQDVALLEKAVNISSGSQNVAGVRKVGELFGAQLAELGFTVRMSDMPASMRRGGHLIAERTGTRGPRILLIGHLDTVFEGEGQRFVRTDSIARGAGTSDMKGGDVAMISALRALHATGGLEGVRITVIMTGDEEAVGTPRELARKDLIDLAMRSDIALAFEGGSASRPETDPTPTRWSPVPYSCPPPLKSQLQLRCGVRSRARSTAGGEANRWNLVGNRGVQNCTQ